MQGPGEVSQLHRIDPSPYPSGSMSLGGMCEEVGGSTTSCLTFTFNPTISATVATAMATNHLLSSVGRTAK